MLYHHAEYNPLSIIFFLIRGFLVPLLSLHFHTLCHRMTTPLSSVSPSGSFATSSMAPGDNLQYTPHDRSRTSFDDILCTEHSNVSATDISLFLPDFDLASKCPISSFQDSDLCTTKSDAGNRQMDDAEPVLVGLTQQYSSHELAVSE
jgi:hypothetical protein